MKMEWKEMRSQKSLTSFTVQKLFSETSNNKNSKSKYRQTGNLMPNLY